MEEEKKATEASAEIIAAQGVEVSPEDAEMRYAKLEEEKENYRKAYLKESSKNKQRTEENLESDESMEDVARRVLAESRLAQIAMEQDDIIKKTLKENKELKAAHLNKKEPPAAAGTHNETIAVRDTLITPEQMAYFKNMKWSDKDIERYKRNLSKRV